MALRFLRDGYFVGKVGIGVASPTVMLQVNGNAYIGTGATDDNLSLRVYGNNAGASRYLELAHTNASSSRLKTNNSYLSLESAGYILLAQSGLFYGDTLILNNKRIKYGESNGGWRDVMYLGTDNVFRIGTISTMSSGGDTAMYHSGSEKVRINSAGVGIGTTSPQYPLHVAGSSSVSAPTGNGVLMGLYAGTYGHIQMNGSSGSYIDFSQSGVDHKGRILYDNGANYLRLDTNGTEKMRITSTGNVGIGTTSPQAKLDIYDTFTKTAANPNTVEVYHTGSVISNGIYPVAGLFTQRVSGSSNSYATGLVGVAEKLGDYGYLAKGVQGIGKLSGNITVNNADMQYMGVEGRIEMEGSNSVNLDDRAYSFYGTAEIDSGSHLKEYHGLYLNTPTNNGTILNKYGVSQVDANSKNYFAGNVGIGTDSPGYKLEVNGQIGFNSGTNYSRIWQTATDTALANESLGSFRFFNSGTETVRIDASGNVGIGTTSPSQKLQVNNGKLYITESASASTANLIYLQNSGSGANEGVSIKFNPMYGAESMIASNREGAASDDTNLTFHTALADVTTERMRIDSSGNVGIGTTSPITKLHLYDNTATVGLSIQADNASNSDINLGDEDDINIGRIQYSHSTDSMQFQTNNAERIRITSAGAIKFNAYDSTNNTGTPTYLLGTDASGNVVKTLSTPSPITSQAASLYDLIPNGAFTTTYAFTSTAGTYAEVMSGNDVITANGTYSVQMYVSDYAVGGTQYSETYSGVMSWGSSTSTNDANVGAISEIALHRAGHAGNQGITYLRTRETTSADNNELKLEIMSNKTYTGASNVVFKFVRLI